MASKYKLIEYDFEEEREKDPQGPPMANIFAAADYISSLLTANGINYGVMGGFAMICRGSHRTTREVNVATNATMGALWAVLEPQPR